MEQLLAEKRQLEAELEHCKRRIAGFEAAGTGGAGLVRCRRTQLLNLAGERCDHVEVLPARITVRELREKIAASKGIKPQRVHILAPCQEDILGDDEEICHEVVAQTKACNSECPQTFDFSSVGEPYHIVLKSETRITYTGRVKCNLLHKDEYTCHEKETWGNDWVNLVMEEKDLGPSNHDQIRVFVGSDGAPRVAGAPPKFKKGKKIPNHESGGERDLVCYGSLKNPFVRQSETWGNKNAGDLQLEVCKKRSAPSMKSGDDCAERYDEEQLFKVDINRYYCVERGDGKYDTFDRSEIWFATDAERAAFVDAWKSWDKNNPMPKKN